MGSASSLVVPDNIKFVDFLKIAPQLTKDAKIDTLEVERMFHNYKNEKGYIDKETFFELIEQYLENHKDEPILASISQEFTAELAANDQSLDSARTDEEGDEEEEQEETYFDDDNNVYQPYYRFKDNEDIRKIRLIDFDVFKTKGSYPPYVPYNTSGKYAKAVEYSAFSDDEDDKKNNKAPSSSESQSYANSSGMIGSSKKTQAVATSSSKVKGSKYEIIEKTDQQLAHEAGDFTVSAADVDFESSYIIFISHVWFRKPPVVTATVVDDEGESKDTENVEEAAPVTVDPVVAQANAELKAAEALVNQHEAEKSAAIEAEKLRKQRAVEIKKNSSNDVESAWDADDRMAVRKSESIAQGDSVDSIDAMQALRRKEAVRKANNMDVTNNEQFDSHDMVPSKHGVDRLEIDYSPVIVLASSVHTAKILELRSTMQPEHSSVQSVHYAHISGKHKAITAAAAESLAHAAAAAALAESVAADVEKGNLDAKSVDSSELESGKPEYSVAGDLCSMAPIGDDARALRRIDSKNPPRLTKQSSSRRGLLDNRQNSWKRSYTSGLTLEEDITTDAPPPLHQQRSFYFDHNQNMNESKNEEDGSGQSREDALSSLLAAASIISTPTNADGTPIPKFKKTLDSSTDSIKHKSPRTVNAPVLAAEMKVAQNTTEPTESINNRSDAKLELPDVTQFSTTDVNISDNTEAKENPTTIDTAEEKKEHIDSNDVEVDGKPDVTGAGSSNSTIANPKSSGKKTSAKTKNHGGKYFDNMEKVKVDPNEAPTPKSIRPSTSSKKKTGTGLPPRRSSKASGSGKGGSMKGSKSTGGISSASINKVPAEPEVPLNDDGTEMKLQSSKVRLMPEPLVDGDPYPDNEDNQQYELCVKGIQYLRDTLLSQVRKVYVWMDYSCLDMQNLLERRNANISIRRNGSIVVEENTKQSTHSALAAIAAGIPIVGAPIEAIEKLKATAAETNPVDGNVAAAKKSSHVNLPLADIMSICDCIFTPLLDKSENWDFPSRISNYYEDYNSIPWNVGPAAYLNRAWCRMEMFYGTNIPILPELKKENDLVKVSRKNRIGLRLRNYAKHGNRPHLLYGSFESRCGIPPLVIPPLPNIYFDKFAPLNGAVTYATDISNEKMLPKLLADLKPYMEREKLGYDGEVNENGKMHGRGVYRWPDGSCYAGEWENGRKHGVGTFTYANGDVYNGEFRRDKETGLCSIKYANGNKYFGEVRKMKKWGHGVMEFVNGDIYEGDFKKDMREGKGKMRYHAKGLVYEGEFKHDLRHGHGILKDNNGHKVFSGAWKYDNKEEHENMPDSKASTSSAHPQNGHLHHHAHGNKHGNTSAQNHNNNLRGRRKSLG